MTDTVTEYSERVIVRTYSAGVLFGTLTDRSPDGKRGTIHQARRIWYWAGAASLSELAVSGPGRPGECKFPVEVAQIEVTEIIEVLAVTAAAAAAIDAVPVWSER